MMKSVRTRVKICGITRLEDAQAAVACGADAIGFVFYKKSPRYVSPAQAKRIVRDLPAFVTPVALFVNESTEEINEIIAQTGIQLLQFHGDETPDECRRYQLPYMKAIRVKADTNLLQCEQDYSDASALLLDTYNEGMPGGTGQIFDWALIPTSLARRVVLAGGLTTENVEAAIRQVRPYAVDVSGGVEKSKGIKDAAKIAAFMRGVINASL